MGKNSPTSEQMGRELPTSEQGFQIGDVVVVVKYYSHPELEGTECRITGSLQPRGCWRCERYITVNAYRTDLPTPGGGVFIAEPHQIRKKRPPREDLQIVRWDQCPWQPEKISV